MIKFILLILVAAMLSGCQPQTSIADEDFAIPPELQDCRFFNMYDGYNNVVVVRCPKADTAASYSSSCGKGCRREQLSTVVEAK